ncbi:hypothetical protein F4V91_06805 [Neorhizobium galegae]|uniref:Uncharacterized protein n=1 Tax=Neorhizobium galegae TaxID=399 RepID=A0A6A1TP54_NEOGA|nr:hypothetical protein [Neorhizobium galegae]KAB1086168.1 hypothetical protein F4V91_06805 [Neorhizobium galegae]
MTEQNLSPLEELQWINHITQGWPYPIEANVTLYFLDCYVSAVRAYDKYHFYNRPDYYTDLALEGSEALQYEVSGAKRRLIDYVTGKLDAAKLKAIREKIAA